MVSAGTGACLTHICRLRYIPWAESGKEI